MPYKWIKHQGTRICVFPGTILSLAAEHLIHNYFSGLVKIEQIILKKSLYLKRIEVFKNIKNTVLGDITPEKFSLYQKRFNWKKLHYENRMEISNIDLPPPKYILYKLSIKKSKYETFNRPNMPSDLLRQQIAMRGILGCEGIEPLKLDRAFLKMIETFGITSRKIDLSKLVDNALLNKDRLFDGNGLLKKDYAKQVSNIENLS